MNVLLEFFGPVLLAGGAIVGMNTLFSEVPLLPKLADKVLVRRLSAYLAARYGLQVTPKQALRLAAGKRVDYDGARGSEKLVLLRPNTPLRSRELVRHVMSSKRDKRGETQLTEQQVPYPQLPSWDGDGATQLQVGGKDEAKKKAKVKQLPVSKVLELTQQVEHLEREVAANADSLPSFFEPSATETFALLKETISAYDSNLYSTEQKYTLEATVNEYLPTLIENAVQLPKAFFRSAANAQTAAAIERQLTLIKRAVQAVHDTKYASAVRSIEQQGYFLNEKFDQPVSPALEI